MAALKIIFMGTAELSCASLEKLAGDKNFSVLAVVTIWFVDRYAETAGPLTA